MRWIFALRLTLLLILAGLTGYGWFGLTPGLKIEQTLEIDRPRAAVFAVVQNLETLPEWAPWLVGVQGARFQSEGLPGKDQKARWSNASLIPSGEQIITQVKENSEVVARLDAEQGSALLQLRLEPKGAATRALWATNSQCGTTPLSIPCRYVLHFLARPNLEERAAMSLANLKVVVERLPDVDFERLSPEFLQVEKTPYAYVESEVGREAAAIAQAEAESFLNVKAYLEANATSLDRPQILHTIKDSGARMSFRAGYVLPQGPAPMPSSDSPVRLNETPAGRALKVTLNGPRSELPKVYAMISAYLQAHRMAPAGGPWEVRYPTAPGADPALTRTEIYYPLR
jgi:hypothetical protein